MGTGRRVGRYVIGLAGAGLAAWVISGKTDELEGATTYLAHLRWWWLAVALAAESASYLAYASMQRRLLRAGEVDAPLATVTGVSLAGQAIQNSLPGGFVIYLAYVFRQYRRFGADDVLAGWTVLAFNVVSFVTLAGVAAVGLCLALAAGNTYDLVEAILGVVIAAALFVLAWAERLRLLPHLARSVRLSQRLITAPHPGRTAEEIIGEWMSQIGAISPSACRLGLGRDHGPGQLVGGPGVPGGVVSGRGSRGPVERLASGLRSRTAGFGPADNSGWPRGGGRQPDRGPGHLRGRPHLHGCRRPLVSSHIILAGLTGRMGGVGRHDDPGPIRHGLPEAAT